MAKRTQDTNGKAKPLLGRLTAPYRFHDEDGQVRQWFAGQPVEADELAMLIERGAPVEVQ